ncbi:hypothetical protein HPB49_005857 [Dermacentor silvarum]|uniref:Uncharacterized protein n=1 Tax=Dermacentor silvarum TaxID=543639 RepID=A0ACB8CVB6_DERSI|nr:hypothetical protein HPB49_005857 [Dermacentor silvarum]
MEQLRTKRGFFRRAITKAVSTIDALLSDEAAPVRVLYQHLERSRRSWRSSSSSTAQFKRRSRMQTWRETSPQLLSTNKRSASPPSRVHRSLLVLPRNLPRHRTQPPLPPRPESHPWLKAREGGIFNQASSSASQRHHPRESRPLELNPPSAVALSTEMRSPYTRSCLLCNASDHTVLECSTSLNSEEKRRKLQARRRCFRCAKRNHVASECRSARNLKCAHCAGQHLTSLCNVCTPTQNHARRLGNASAPSVQRASGSESVNKPPPATSVSSRCTGSHAGITTNGQSLGCHTRKVNFAVFPA